MTWKAYQFAFARYLPFMRLTVIQAWFQKNTNYLTDYINNHMGTYPFGEMDSDVPGPVTFQTRWWESRENAIIHQITTQFNKTGGNKPILVTIHVSMTGSLHTPVKSTQVTRKALMKSASVFHSPMADRRKLKLFQTFTKVPGFYTEYHNACIRR